MPLCLPKPGLDIAEVALASLQAKQVEHGEDRADFYLPLTLPEGLEGVVVVVAHGVGLGVEEALR